MDSLLSRWLIDLFALQEREQKTLLICRWLEKMAMQRPYRVHRHLQPDSIVRDGVPDQLVYLNVKDYCRTIQVVESFHPLGEVQPAPGGPPHQPHHVLSDAAQSLTRGMISIERDLFSHDLCLTQILSDTFVVDTSSARVYLSRRAYKKDMVQMNISQAAQHIDQNMDFLSTLIVQDVIGNDPVPVEVAQGLIPLMKTQGDAMLHVIHNHPSLVPIGNRLHLNLRMHDHLRDILFGQNRKHYNQVLRGLRFPQNWHALVKVNTFLAQLYAGSNYGPRMSKNLVQESHVLRYNRNASEHGMASAVDPNTLVVLYMRPDLAKMLYTVFPLFLHSLMVGLHILGRLEELMIEELFLCQSDI